MRADRTLYYVTDRKGSRDEPLDENGKKSSVSAGRQKYYGPFRSDKLIYGKYSIDGDAEPVLGRLSGCESIPLDTNTEVLVFVHGFNSPFAAYTKVLAELAKRISGEVESNETNDAEEPESDRAKLIFILYSWPSMGSPFAYMQDECTVQYSYTNFKKFLDEIKARVGSSSRIHIVGHSLGCQLVYRYLLDRDFKKQNGTQSASSDEVKSDSPNSIEDTAKTAGTVIMSCPDLDYQTVSLDSEREKFSRSVSRGFILVSDVDGPLELSRALHGYTRMGRPALPSAKSLFWGTFRTGSIRNIISTAAHAPEIIARRTIMRLASGFRNPDEVWQEENKHKGIEFAENVQLYDFTIADRRQQSLGHSICIDLIASLFKDGTPPKDWSEEAIVKVPDEFVECSLVPYARSKPYEDDEHKLFLYKKLTPPAISSKRSLATNQIADA